LPPSLSSCAANSKPIPLLAVERTC
jgi:hypothetical protein